MRILIIEDERKAAQELRSLILSLKPEWNIVEILPSAGEAIEWLTENKMPDLIFSDIQLADAVSFDIFQKVRVDCPIIFCTAYDEYAIKAFETSSIDYLLKPVDKGKLERALLKLDKMRSLFASNTGNSFVDMGKLIGQLSSTANKTILVHHKEKIIPVNYADIAYFYYGQGVVAIKLNNGGSYHISQGIDEIEASSDTRLFYRANRQFLINRNAIRNIEKFFARKLVVKMNMDTPETLIVSKAKASDFLNWLENGS
ncbi:MAG TPA: LytTR family DNA-binding domain-containing protein [Puia sp.]|nr:LytTR family DNA-binding domain-containing protein [Puia sp.]